MSVIDSSRLSEMPRVFSRETLIEGHPRRISCVEICGQIYSITRGPITIVRLEDEWYDDVRDPDAVIDTLKRAKGVGADITHVDIPLVLKSNYCYGAPCNRIDLT